MKCFILFLLGLFCLSTADAQLKPGDKLVTTTTLPEGTTVQQGKIMVKSGYRAAYGEKDSKVVIVQSTNKRLGGNGVISGSFTCMCLSEYTTDDCVIGIRAGGTEIYCSGEKCKNCSMNVTIKPKVGLAITRQTKGEVWKKFVPAKMQ